MNLKELKELRATKVKEMEVIGAKHSDNMSEDVLETVKSIKAEIRGIDMSIETQNEIRSVAIKTSTPEKSKANVETELRSAFDGYIRGNTSERDFKKQVKEIRANTVTVNGADLVPDEFRRSLIEKIKEYGMIFNKSTSVTTSDNGELLIPVMDDTANAGTWLAEGATITKSDFASSNKVMNAYKVATGIQVSTELLEDSAFDIGSFITDNLATRIARTIESAFISGDGVAKPEGILVNAGTVAKVTAVVADTSIVDLEALIYSIDPSERMGAEFLVSDTLMAILTFSKDSTGRPLLQGNNVATSSDVVKYTLFGYPISVNYELGDAGTTGDNVAIFGNLKKYWVRNTRAVSIKRDDYTAMDTDSVNFYATMRLDAKVISAEVSFAKLTVA